MRNVEEVVRYIEDEMNKAADAQCNQILAEINQVKQTAEAELYDEVKSELALRYENDLALIESEAALAISKSNSETTKKLIAKREEFAQLIFAEVEKRLSAFINSVDYIDYLVKKVKKVANLSGEKASVFMIAEADFKYVDQMKEAYGHDCSFEVDSTIHFGGFRFCYGENRMVYDETIDSLLADQQEWFAHHSGLMIR